MRILGLVPARGGSRGVPRKNVRLLCGRPLLAYTADAASAARGLSRVVLSTEDEEIAEVGLQCGLEVAFMRPAELARDDTPMLPVVEHALRWMDGQGDRFDAVCLLQPTTPLRRPEDIDGCIRLLQERDADAVMTVLLVPAQYHPSWAYSAGADGFLRLALGDAAPVSRRQDLPPAYCRDGSVYLTRREVILDGRSLYGKRLVGYFLDPARSVNIDSEEDWQRAEDLIRGQRQR